MTITPIEETYALLNKYNIFFNDGNAERVDTLSYGWKKLIAQVSLAFSLLHDDKFLYFNCYSIYNVINQGFIFSKLILVYTDFQICLAVFRNLTTNHFVFEAKKKKKKNIHQRNDQTLKEYFSFHLNKLFL